MGFLKERGEAAVANGASEANQSQRNSDQQRNSGQSSPIINNPPIRQKPIQFKYKNNIQNDKWKLTSKLKR